ncbi:site-specific integrase [uncultured Duncaniella sp.]|uniref:site-specific integrase n=1 Tax=uncultured Duncaniella sp. TaxID=2768039 RepID=UPI000F519E02|nr:site-specific integrase [uncultured Duncaniella sp.]ROS84353.1 site-specific integrase [Muribaculaceae bacterium Isolate-036 (Harlan)]RXE65259.1 site-specific integrase [Muribaculaceae bacterium Isolate-001 (NCI)]
MASIKVKFRPSTVADHEGTIYYQIIHERKVRQLLSDYKVYPSEWDESRSIVTTTQKSERKAFILSIRERIRWDVERLNKIDKKLDANGLSYTADDVIDEFNRYANEYSLFNFMESIIVKLKQNGKVRTSETYKSALSSFKKFLARQASKDDYRQDEDIMLDCLTSEIMEAYEAWHKSRGVAPNTISFYTRILRAVYNRAVEDDIIENRNPFKHVYTGVDKTVKRALSLPVIKKIKALDLSLNASLDFSRDMFLMSFYLRGMSFIDMAFLKKSDLKNGYVTYRRRKTGQQLIIEWTKEMQIILDKYPENATEYLLPIIKNPGTNERCTYRNMGYNINHNLKKIAKMVGVQIPLTLYVARHSWASAAKAKGIPLSVISEGMGHDSEATTQIYLASLDTSVVDRANSIILNCL